MGSAAGKRDAGKLPYNLITVEMDKALASVLQFGAGKYAPRAWEEGVVTPDQWFAAARRHMEAHRNGEFHDPESGLPHLWHAFTGIGMWLTLVERGAYAPAPPRNTCEPTTEVEASGYPGV